MGKTIADHKSISIYRFGNFFGGLNIIDISRVRNNQRKFLDQDRVGKSLYPVSSRRLKNDIDEKTHIVGKTALRKFNLRRLRSNDNVIFVRRYDPNFGLVNSLAAPMIYHGEFYQGHGQFFDHNVLENSH